MSYVQCEWVVITVVVMVIGASQIFYGLRKASGFWLGIGVLMMILPILRIVIVWDYNRRMEEKYGPIEDVSSASATPAPTPAPVLRKRSIGSEGWVGRFRDAKGVVITLTIPPAESARQRELAAPFAGATKKLGLVGAIALDNRSQRAVQLDTAGAVLYLVDGTQAFTSSPADVIASIGSPQREKDLAAFRPPYSVAPNTKLSLGVLFVPADADLSSLDHVRLTLDGKWVDVR